MTTTLGATRGRFGLVIGGWVGSPNQVLFVVQPVLDSERSDSHVYCFHYKYLMFYFPAITFSGIYRRNVSINLCTSRQKNIEKMNQDDNLFKAFLEFSIIFIPTIMVQWRHTFQKCSENDLKFPHVVSLARVNKKRVKALRILLMLWNFTRHL